MNSLRGIRRQLLVALSAALWAESGLALLPAVSQASQCHVRVLHTQQTHSMPCCPRHTVSAPSFFFEPPPCCDLSNQPARPVAFVVTSGGRYSTPLPASDIASVIFVPPQGSSALSLMAASPPFVKPVFDLKSDLRI